MSFARVRMVDLIFEKEHSRPQRERRRSALIGSGGRAEETSLRSVVGPGDMNVTKML